MHSLRFNSSRLLVAALPIGATVGLVAQPAPPIDVNTAIRIDFVGAITNPQPEFAEYFGKRVSGSLYIYSPNFRPWANGYDDVPEDDTYWGSNSDVPVGMVSATLNMDGVFTSTFYTNVSGVRLSDNTFVSPYVGRVYADQFGFLAGNWNSYNASSVVNYNGTDYSLPSAFIEIAGLVSEFTGKSVFGVPTDFNSITGLSLLDSSDMADPRNAFEGWFNFYGTSVAEDFTFNITSLSATTVVIPEPQTYALALGAASLALVGAMKLRRRRTGRA